MIEIRTYEGDAAALSRFTREAWRASYEGRMMFPLWSPQYFDWQLLADSGSRDYLVAAYQGSKLIGTLLAEQFRFRIHGREVNGTTGSWLSVHPDYRRMGVGSKLFEEQRRRHLERSAPFMLGYIYTGSSTSLGPKFWLSFPDPVVLTQVGFWVRILDHQAVARWELSQRDAWAVRVLSLLQHSPATPLREDAGIRPYTPNDLSPCVDLVHGLLRGMDLGYVWTADRLARQLDYQGVPRTLVAQEAGGAAGFINYYRLDYLGRWPIETAIIDLLAFGTLPSTHRRRLLSAALGRMKNEGIKMAVMLRLPCYPARPMLAAGFLPVPQPMSVIGIRMDPAFSLNGAARLHVHMR